MTNTEENDTKAVPKRFHMSATASDGTSHTPSDALGASSVSPPGPILGELHYVEDGLLTRMQEVVDSMFAALTEAVPSPQLAATPKANISAPVANSRMRKMSNTAAHSSNERTPSPTTNPTTNPIQSGRVSPRQLLELLEKLHTAQCKQRSQLKEAQRWLSTDAR